MLDCPRAGCPRAGCLQAGCPQASVNGWAAPPSHQRQPQVRGSLDRNQQQCGSDPPRRCAVRDVLAAGKGLARSTRWATAEAVWQPTINSLPNCQPDPVGRPSGPVVEPPRSQSSIAPSTMEGIHQTSRIVLLVLAVSQPRVLVTG